MSLELWLGAVILAALMLYSLTAGADFGGGVWELLARGPRAQAQRRLIAEAIAPIWEANHVWLIVVIVLLFTAFPLAFAAIMTALNIPLTLMLIGIVLRGAAFAFRAYGIQSEGARRTWERLFALASVYTPVMLGIVLGATISDAIRVDLASGEMTVNFWEAWLRPFPFAVGLLVLALFAFLAAVYLAVEAAGEPELQEDFRRRGLGTAVVVGLLAFGTLLLARSGAPRVFTGLTGHWWSPPLQIVIGLAAVGTMAALWQRRYLLARLLAIAQVGLMVLGFGLALFPYIVPPDLTLMDTAAPRSVLLPVSVVLLVGLLLIGPAFWWLYAIFKGDRGEHQPIATK
jgi:cytochrome d ubiquinol oxidase subunit II